MTDLELHGINIIGDPGM